MSANTIMDYLDRWNEQCPERVWLKDRQGDEFTEWNWRQVRQELLAVATWLEKQLGDQASTVAILSRNRAHWMLADMAVIASGNVTVPIFTTQAVDTCKYIFDFADIKVLFLGEAENWQHVQEVLPEHARIVALPGVDPGTPHLRWQDILDEHRGQQPAHHCQHDELLSIVFTSGTTGAPKGVMQTHDSMLIPMERAAEAFSVRALPHLSHLASFFLALFLLLFFVWERRAGPPPDELVYWQSVLVVILLCGPVTWAMSTVWLLPVVPIVLREVFRLGGRRQVLALLGCVLGLLLVALPDPYGNFMLSPFGQGLLDGKYVVGQLLCLAGLLGLWRREAPQRTTRGSTPVT